MRNIEDLRDLLEIKELERDSLENDLSILDDDIYEKGRYIHNLKIDLNNEMSEMEDLQDEFDDLEEELSRLNDEIYDLEIEIEDLESEEM